MLTSIWMCCLRVIKKTGNERVVETFECGVGCGLVPGEVSDVHAGADSCRVRGDGPGVSLHDQCCGGLGNLPPQHLASHPDRYSGGRLPLVLRQQPAREHVRLISHESMSYESAPCLLHPTSGRVLVDGAWTAPTHSSKGECASAYLSMQSAFCCL
eukprot:g50302.t1